MTKLSVFCLLLLSLACHAAPGSDEELFIVTNAPIAVGNGIIRYYPASGNGHVSIRYTYEGTDSGMIFLEKITYSDIDNSSSREIVKIPPGSSGNRKKWYLQLGSRKIQFTLHKHGRVSAKEVK
ncbi:MAG: hypothetical protein ABIA77_02775 [Candidatus Omnitrophota bacterium]